MTYLSRGVGVGKKEGSRRQGTGKKALWTRANEKGRLVVGSVGGCLLITG